MDIKQMEYLVKIYETKSLTEAASKLYITPQALSKVLRNIEDEYKKEVLIRNGNRFTFSEFGEMLVSEAKKMLVFNHNFNSNVSSFKSSKHYELSIDMPINSILMYGYNEYKSLSLEFKDCDLLVSEYNDFQIENRIRDDLSDIAFIVNDIPNKHLYEIMPILVYYFGIVVSKKHPLAKKSKVSVLDICPFPIISRNHNYKIHYQLDEILRPTNKKLKYSLLTPDGLLMSEAVKDNITVFVALNFTKLDDKDLIFIPFKERIEWALSIAIKKNRMNDPHILAFYHYVNRKYFKG